MLCLRDLIERLEELAEELGDDTEVRMMTQQNWPFENSVLGVTTSVEMAECDSDEDDEDEEGEDVEPVVFLVEGQQLGYGSKRAWEVCGG